MRIHPQAVVATRQTPRNVRAHVLNTMPRSLFILTIAVLVALTGLIVPNFAIAQTNAYSYNTETDELVSIDTVTGEVTTIGGAGGDFAIDNMRLVGDKIWATVGNTSLGWFDTASGTFTLVGLVTLGGIPILAQGLAEQNNELLVTVSPSGNSGFVSELARLGFDGVITEEIVNYGMMCERDNCIDMDTITNDPEVVDGVIGMNWDHWGEGDPANGVFVFRADPAEFVIEAKLPELSDPTFAIQTGFDLGDGELVVIADTHPVPTGMRLYYVEVGTWDVTPGPFLSPDAAYRGLELYEPRADCLELTVENLVAGEDAVFTLSGGTPGARGGAAFGTLAGTTVFDQPNFCATFEIQGVMNPAKVIGDLDQVFDSAGTISLTQSIPANASGLDVLFQGAEFGTCPEECMSNLVETTVE